MENTTISHNRANVRGGGMYHDADADFKIVNTTIWRNSAPFGGGARRPSSRTSCRASRRSRTR